MNTRTYVVFACRCGNRTTDVILRTRESIGARTIQLVQRRALSLAAWMLTAIATAACGASYQSVYEGDVRFEHCYRLDAETSVAHDAKLACWQEWAKQYTRGQTRDRVEYALDRERQLLSGDNRLVGPTLIATPDGAPKPVMAAAVGSGPSVACPLPSDAFQAPPPTMAVDSAPPKVALVATAEPLTSSQSCVQDCGKTFTVCATKCKKQSCINKCGDLAKSCIGECL